MTRDTDYAVRALIFIAKEGRRVVSVTEMSDRLKIPRSFLRKILQLLSKRGIVKSRRGQGGGFELVLQPARIHLSDLIGVFQGEVKFSDCILKGDVCADVSRCVLRQRITDVERHLLAELKAITLKSLLGN